jgi:hypothetical protein
MRDMEHVLYNAGVVYANINELVQVVSREDKESDIFSFLTQPP